MPRPQQPKRPERKPTRDDELHVEAVTYCAKRIVEHLRRAVAGRPHRSIASLQRHEIMAFTEDCVSAWCSKRVEQARAAKLSVDATEQFILGS